jgi:hypothetical protein
MQSVISTLIVLFPHAESDFYTQSVILHAECFTHTTVLLTRMTVECTIMTLSMITTRSSVIYARRVQFIRTV